MKNANGARCGVQHTRSSTKRIVTSRTHVNTLHGQIMKLTWRTKTFIVCMGTMRWWTWVLSLVPPQASSSSLRGMSRSLTLLQSTVRNAQSVKNEKNIKHDVRSRPSDRQSPLRNWIHLQSARFSNLFRGPHQAFSMQQLLEHRKT